MSAKRLNGKHGEVFASRYVTDPLDRRGLRVHSNESAPTKQLRRFVFAVSQIDNCMLDVLYASNDTLVPRLKAPIFYPLYGRGSLCSLTGTRRSSSCRCDISSPPRRGSTPLALYEGPDGGRPPAIK